MTAFWVLLPLCNYFQNSYRARSARAMYAEAYVAMPLGYFLHPTKSNIFPTQDMVHLGFGVNSALSAFYIAEKCRRKFITFQTELLDRGSANLHDLQRWTGKCNHMGMVFPANSLFTFECRRLMPTLGEERVRLPKAALDEISFWSFVGMHTEPIPFRRHQHVSIRLSTDASGYAWGAIVDLPSGQVELRDYWTSRLLAQDICVKEGLAAFFCLQSVRQHLFDRRVDVFVDNEGLVKAWEGLRSRSAELVEVLKSLFLFCVDSRLTLKLIWISTKENPADAPSRVLDRSDSMLSDSLRALLWRVYGPFSFDLMALPSNVFRDPAGRPLPFYSRSPLFSASGTNVFAQPAPAGRAYVFPPFSVIVPLIRLFMEQGVKDVVMVLPVWPGRPASWRHLLLPFIQDELVLSAPGGIGVLRYPSSAGFCDSLLPVPFGLSAFRCGFPSVPSPQAPLPPPPVPVLFGGDSVLRPFSSLDWPSPLRVEVRAYSGAPLRRVLESVAALSDVVDCRIVVIHAGVNDCSKAGETFESDFRDACSFASQVLPSRFPGRHFFFSTICVSRSAVLNARILIANRALRELAAANAWSIISNDNVRTSDLIDDVHLNAAGTARFFQNFVNAVNA